MFQDDEWLDLVAGLRDAEDQDVRDEAYEVFVAEAARSRLVDRVGPGRVLLACGVILDGTLEPTGHAGVAGHVRLRESSGRLVLITGTAIVTITGPPLGLRRESLTAPAGPSSSHEPGSSITRWLRDGWREGAWLAALTIRGHWVRGGIVGVGADQVDLRRDDVTVTVGIGAVEAWTRD